MTLIADHITGAFTALLAGKTSADMPLFSSMPTDGSPYTRNPTCWAASLDITALGIWPGVSFHGYALTRMHVAVPNHLNMADGTVFHFVGSDGVCYPRTLVSHLQVGTSDIRIYRLNAALPSAITPAVILPSPTIWKAKFSFLGSGLPAFVIHQDNKAAIDTISGLGSNNGYETSFQGQAPSPWGQFFVPVQSGDSGGPGFLPINGVAVLAMSGWHTFASGPNPSNEPLLQSTIDTIGPGGYNLTVANISGFTDAPTIPWTIASSDQPLTSGEISATLIPNGIQSNLAWLDAGSGGIVADAGNSVGILTSTGGNGGQAVIDLQLTTVTLPDINAVTRLDVSGIVRQWDSTSDGGDPSETFVLQCQVIITGGTSTAVTALLTIPPNQVGSGAVPFGVTFTGLSLSQPVVDGLRVKLLGTDNGTLDDGFIKVSDVKVIPWYKPAYAAAPTPSITLAPTADGSALTSWKNNSAGTPVYTSLQVNGDGIKASVSNTLTITPATLDLVHGDLSGVPDNAIISAITVTWRNVTSTRSAGVGWLRFKLSVTPDNYTTSEVKNVSPGSTPDTRDLSVTLTGSWTKSQLTSIHSQLQTQCGNAFTTFTTTVDSVDVSLQVGVMASAIATQTTVVGELEPGKQYLVQRLAPRFRTGEPEIQPLIVFADGKFAAQLSKNSKYRIYDRVFSNRTLRVFQTGTDALSSGVESDTIIKDSELTPASASFSNTTPSEMGTRIFGVLSPTTTYILERLSPNRITPSILPIALDSSNQFNMVVERRARYRIVDRNNRNKTLAIFETRDNSLMAV